MPNEIDLDEAGTKTAQWHSAVHALLSHVPQKVFKI